MDILNHGTLTLGMLAKDRPASIAVFERLGLDYCCGGRHSLEAVCRHRGLDPAAVLEAIAAQERAVGGSEERAWDRVSMAELADNVEQVHHAFTRDALARLKNVVPRVVAAHGASHPELKKVAEILETFAEEMHDHMVREERVVFPWLKRLERPTEIHSGPPWSVKRPISCMIHDHDDAGQAMASMRALTDNFTPPAGACNTYRSMLTTLAQLERDLHVHIHKENNILFPAGIRAEEEHLAREAERVKGSGPG